MEVVAKKDKRLLALAEKIFYAKALHWYKETELIEDFYPNSFHQIVSYLRQFYPQVEVQLRREALNEARRM